MLDTASFDTAMLDTAMFDTVLGLPVHVLVVHAVVVLVPLMALVTAAVAIAVVVRRNGWWASLVWPVAVLDVGLVGLTLLARESGRTLQGRLGGQTAQEHAALGEWLPWFVLALAASSLTVAVLSARGRERDGETAHGWLMKRCAVLTVISAVATTGWVVVVGHTGTQAVWQDRIEFSNTR